MVGIHSSWQALPKRNPSPRERPQQVWSPEGSLESGGWHRKMFIPKVPKVVAQPRPLLEQMLSVGQSSAGRSRPSRLPVGTRPLRAGSRLRSWCRRLHPRGLSPRASVCSAARAENPTRVREGKHVLRSRHIPNFAVPGSRSATSTAGCEERRVKAVGHCARLWEPGQSRGGKHQPEGKRGTAAALWELINDIND